MDGHVDWLTWTMLPSRRVESVTEVYDRARRMLRGISNEHEKIFFGGLRFDRSARISNFDICLHDDTGTRQIGGVSPSGHMLFQLSGRGCDAIREPSISRRFVAEIAELLTRFDYAVDVRTDTRPSEFANSRGHRSMRTIQYIKSETGETVYVGSTKSDRFCRVYRYNPPHPRADLLRVEFVFRRQMARTAAAQYCAKESDSEFLTKIGNSFGWTHPDWQTTRQTNERLGVPSVDRRTEDTIAWLYKQVAPAMKRVLKTGGFDMADFLAMVYENHD